MKAISIKNPWGSLVTLGIKDVENRTWKTNFRGEVLIHTSSIRAGRIEDLLLPKQKAAINDFNGFELKPQSAIIGKIDIIDCVQHYPSIWSEVDLSGERPIWNWVLRNAVLFKKPILNVKGKLSFWDFDDSLLKDVL